MASFAADAARNAVQTKLEPLTDRVMRSSKSRSRNKSNRQRSLGNIVNRVFDSSGPEGKVRGTPQQIIEKYLTLARDAQLSNDRVAEQSFLQHAEHYTRMLGEAQREMAERQNQHQQNNPHHQQNRQGGDDEQGRDAQNRDSGRGEVTPQQNGRDHAGRDRDQNQRDGHPPRDHAQSESESVPDRRADAPATTETSVESVTRKSPGRNRRAAPPESGDGLPDAVGAGEDDKTGPVETPEAGAAKPARSRAPRGTARAPATRSRRKPAAEPDEGVAVPQGGQNAAPEENQS
tara:strand:- start:2031 stop:2900 length:870 start_codon:yes stop_codon:yes gene_type:complete